METNTVIASIISSVGITGTLGYLCRTWITTRLKESIQNEYAQKRIQFEADLKSQHALELEKLRSSLNLEAVEYRIRFSQYHDKMSEIIIETYALMMKFQSSASRCLVRHYESESNLMNCFNVNNDNLRKFAEFYHRSKLFLPSEACELIEHIHMTVSDISLSSLDYLENNMKDKIALQAEYETLAEMLVQGTTEEYGKLEKLFQQLLGMYHDEAIKKLTTSTRRTDDDET